MKKEVKKKMLPMWINMLEKKGRIVFSFTARGKGRCRRMVWEIEVVSG